MSKTVLGVYNSKEDLVQAIEEFQNEGYSVSNFSLIADTSEVPSSIENETGVPAEEVSGDNHYNADQHQGFFESLLHPFDDNTNPGEGGSTYYDHLVAEGINEADAKKYEEDINSGMILLLAENGAGTGVSGDTLTRPANGTGVSGDVTTGSMEDAQTNLYSGKDSLDTDQERSLKLREEQLDVSKDRVQAGEVQVKKDVVEEQKTVNVPVSHEEVYVERRAVDNREADTDVPIGDDETIRVPIVEEKVEVTKKPVVNEELVIGKKQVTETQQVSENIKREEAKVEKDGNASVNETDIDTGRKDSDRL